MYSSKKQLIQLFKASGKYIALDSAQRVFIGRAGHMKQAEVASYETLRDGGTKQIRLKDGSKIYIPTRFEPTLNATFNDAVITELDASDEELVSSLRIEDIEPKSAAPVFR